MTKLVKQMYYNSKGEKKLNCYKATIPKELVNKTNLEDKEIKVYAEGNKIIIEKGE